MTKISDFLKPKPNRKRKLSRFVMLLDEYEAKFHEFPSTEPAQLTEEELCDALEESLKTGKTFEDVLGWPEYDPEKDEDW